MYLRQSTASQTRTIGPFVDSGDFVTLKNALTIANTDILLKKNGGASAAKNSGGATADGSGGMYHLTFDATDTATVGELFGSVKVSGALAVFFRMVVLEEAVYDALFAASAPGYGVAQTGDSFARIGATGSGLTSLASAANLAIVAGYLDTEIASILAAAIAIQAKTDGLPSDPADASDIAASFSSIASTLSTIAAYIDTEVAAIKAKTDNLPASPAAVGSAMVLSSSGLDAILVESGISAGTGLVNDTGTQLTAINVRQAIAAILSAVSAVLTGSQGTTITIRPAGKPAGSARLTVTVNSDEERTAVNYRVPD